MEEHYWGLNRNTPAQDFRCIWQKEGREEHKASSFTWWFWCWHIMWVWALAPYSRRISIHHSVHPSALGSDRTWWWWYHTCLHQLATTQTDRAHREINRMQTQTATWDVSKSSPNPLANDWYWRMYTQNSKLEFGLQCNPSDLNNNTAVDFVCYYNI